MRGGSVGAWKEVMNAYYQDKLDAAYDGAMALGADFGGVGALLYRQIEAEYLTRKNAKSVTFNDWLGIEFVEDEVPHGAQLQEPILRACDEIARRLDWSHGPRVLISVLTQEADAPWTIGRFGYFIDKTPYNKICIPYRSAYDPVDLHSVILHEYAHAIVLNMAQGHAPRWMDEMIAMTAQGGPDPDYPRSFAQNRLPWLDPEALNLNYLGEREGHAGRQVYHAYQQSACIGLYIVKSVGEKSFAKLLRSFSDNTFIQELTMWVAGTKPVDEAIRQAYGITERQLFEKALAWLKTI